MVAESRESCLSAGAGVVMFSSLVLLAILPTARISSSFISLYLVVTLRALVPNALDSRSVFGFMLSHVKVSAVQRAYPLG